MKQIWNMLLCALALTAFVAAAASAQTPPSELEGVYSPTDHANELRWHAPDVVPAPVAYNVYRKLDSDASFQLFASAADRRYDDDSISIGLTYQYKVSAVYTGGAESSPTNTVSVTAGDSAGAGAGSLPPRSLAGLVDDRGAVELSWTAPDSLQVPLLYRVYRNGNGDSLFTMIGTAAELEFNDSLVAPNAPYGYYVTALYAGAVESVPSNTINVLTTAAHDSSTDDGGGGGSSASLHFTSTPATGVQVNQPYAYAPVLVTQPAGQTVCFELHNAPAGMTMDPGTGALQWTPTSLGVFEVEIRARICSGDGDAEQKFTVMVMSGAPGQISGHVVNALSMPVARVRIKIFDATSGKFVLRTRTDSAGFYNFAQVNPGTYFIRADADSDRFEDIWYNGAKRLADATGVAVAEGASVTADFVLQPHLEDAPEHITISGLVLDSAGVPISGAQLMAFETVHRDSTNDDLFNDDSRHHHGESNDYSATTDSTGAYHLHVETGTYFLRAKAHGFFEQYWNGKATILDADQFTALGDTAGVDFRLMPGAAALAGTGSITGTIRSAVDSLPRRSHVMGFQKNFLGQFTGFVASTRSDSAGHYALTALPTGFFVVLAKDDDESIPAFYTPSGGTAFLDSAALLFVDGAAVPGADIYISDDSADGLNEIEGEVETEHPGKAGARVIAATAPLPGTIVLVTAADGSLACATLTDNAGSYVVSGLAAGTYTVTFQKPGSASAQSAATLDYLNNAPTTLPVNAVLTAQPAAQTGLMGVRASWNLVSVPVGAPDLSQAALFPTASSQAFSFAGSYSASSVLEAGRGYWVKFPANQVLSIPGAERLAQTVPLNKGWNLVGSLSYPVAAAGMETSPAGLLSSDFFSYSSGYAAAAVIEPGRGYWVKASDAGTLTMQVTPGAMAAVTAAPRPVEAGLNSLTIADDQGNAQTLSLGSASLSAASELPPSPPAGAFDARFASGKMIENAPLGDAATREYAITVQSDGRPLTVSWNLQPSGARYRLTDANGTTVASSDKGTSVIAAGSASRLILVAEASAVPTHFALQQNYPNPFNPTTSVRFELPAAGKVTIRVYNLLGQEVAVLLENSELGAGVHDVTFDASRFASGIYLYRMDAVSSENHSQAFSDVRKMVLLK
jgi:hypothetical protein